jgi:hypothetical protein
VFGVGEANFGVGVGAAFGVVGGEGGGVEKCLVVGLWLVVLVIHRNFRIARYGLWLALVVYAGILVYHFILQSFGPSTFMSPDLILEPTGR